MTPDCYGIKVKAQFFRTGLFILHNALPISLGIEYPQNCNGVLLFLDGVEDKIAIYQKFMHPAFG